MWGIVAAPLGIDRHKLARDFTLRHTARSMVQNSLIFGSFLSVFTGNQQNIDLKMSQSKFTEYFLGVQCTLSPILSKFKLVNAFLSGSTAGFIAALVDSKNISFARKVGPLAGLCTTVIIYLKDRIDEGGSSSS